MKTTQSRYMFTTTSPKKNFIAKRSVFGLVVAVRSKHPPNGDFLLWPSMSIEQNNYSCVCFNTCSEDYQFKHKGLESCMSTINLMVIKKNQSCLRDRFNEAESTKRLNYPTGNTPRIACDIGTLRLKHSFCSAVFGDLQSMFGTVQHVAWQMPAYISFNEFTMCWNIANVQTTKGRTITELWYSYMYI